MKEHGVHMQLSPGPARVARILIISLMLVMAACDATTTTHKKDATPTATAIPKLVNCAATLPDEMLGAQVVAIPGTDFPNSGAAIVVITSPASAPMQIVQYTACMQVFVKGSVGHVSVPVVSNTSSPTAEVIEALNLVNRGWRSTPSFPYDGTNLQPCTMAQICYASDPQHFLELEQIRDRSQGVLTFVVRVAAPQPLVSCDPALFAADFYPDSTAVLANAEFPLPPATRVSTGYGDTEGIITYFCTRGTSASIQSFMAKHLPGSGWSLLTVNGMRLWQFPSGIGPIYMRILPITDPHKWAILTYNSGTTFG